MIAVINYDAGNLKSIVNALNYLDVPNFVTQDSNELNKADGIILPGVGAFPRAMEKLQHYKFDTAIKQEVAVGKPLLGICLGMQLICSRSFEFGVTRGLGRIEADVIEMQPKEGLKVPHMGWNNLCSIQDSKLLADINDNNTFYFVHSFCVKSSKENVLAFTDHTEKFASVIGKGNVFGAQFHPEKSAKAGLTFLSNFARLVNDSK